MIVVSNSSPLISLAKIESFDLLRQLYGTITISEDVFDEVVVWGAGLAGAIETSDSPWIHVKPVKRNDVTAAQERFGLGLGELSTLVLAREVGAELVILDDLGARKLAQREGFRIQGTIAILEAGFRKGHLADLRGAYTQLLSRGVFLDRGLLNHSLASLQLAPI